MRNLDRPRSPQGQCAGREYVVSQEGIILRDPTPCGILSAIDDLIRKGLLENVLQPTDAPASRWSELLLVEVTDLPAPAHAYLDALSREYANGTVMFHCYRVVERERFDNCLHEHPPEVFTAAFTAELFRNPAFRTLAPVNAGALSCGADIPWMTSSPFHLTATLADMLYRGGAYSPTRDAAEVLRIAQQARIALWGSEENSPESIFYLFSDAPWSPWFYNVAWDNTLIVLNRTKGEISCLFASDTD